MFEKFGWSVANGQSPLKRCVGGMKRRAGIERELASESIEMV